MQRTTALATAKVAATYAGTVIGAGFASGQEFMQFFVNYGSIGLVGVFWAGSLFAWLGSELLETGYRLHATSYQQVLHHVCGKKIGGFLDIITTIFLFSVLSIMLAGAGTVGRDYFDLPFYSGMLLLAFAITLTVLNGLKGITTANTVITPLLTFAILFVGGNSLAYHGIHSSLLYVPPLPADSRPAPHWLLSCLLYVSYNLVMSSTVLAPLGATTASRRVRFLGGIAGGIILALLAGFITSVILIHYPDIIVEEVPMLYISSAQHSWSHTMYAFALLSAMYTTGLAACFGCVTKMRTKIPASALSSILILMSAALLFSQVGFASLIALLFPIFGYISLWFTVKLIWQHFFPNS